MGGKMTRDINKKIIDKINECNYDEGIKEFLKTLLILELDHFEEGRWIYHNTYDREIINYANKYGGRRNEI